MSVIVSHEMNVACCCCCCYFFIFRSVERLFVSFFTVFTVDEIFTLKLIMILLLVSTVSNFRMMTNANLVLKAVFPS